MKPEVFLTLEDSIASTIGHRWHKIAAELVGQIEPLIKAKKFADAHYAVDQMSLMGVVQQEANRVEELLISTLLFGAHNCAGHVNKTAFIAKNAAIPDAIQHAVTQLVVMVEQNGAETIRKELHDVIRDEELLALVVKADSGPNSTTGNKSLYVHRPVLNPDDILAWAKEQGFPSALNPDDLHVTVCYSKVPVDWNATRQQHTSIDAEGGPRSIHRFGDAIVLQFWSDELLARWQEFQDIGASWDHDGYRPHVTISYDPNFNIENVEPYTGRIYLGGEEFAPVKNNWADDIEEVELRKAEMSLAERLNDAVLNGNRLVVDTSANLTTSRLVTLGYLSEAKDRGITTYQISEVLDDKTCPICRYMHGKTFKVDDQYSRTLQALMTQDPKQLKEVMPWPKQTKAGLKAFREKSLDQIQADGQGAPPFHPECRGHLVNVGTVTENVPLGQLEIPGLELETATSTDSGPVTVIPASTFSGKPVPPKPAPVHEITNTYLHSLISQITDQKLREQALAFWNDGNEDDLRRLLTGLKLLF